MSGCQVKAGACLVWCWAENSAASGTIMRGMKRFATAVCTSLRLVSSRCSSRIRSCSSVSDLLPKSRKEFGQRVILACSSFVLFSSVLLRVADDISAHRLLWVSATSKIVLYNSQDNCLSLPHGQCRTCG